MLKAGQRFGNYELLERLGDGGMGVIYRAVETSLGRQVALRLIPPQAAPDGTTRARLNREVTLLAGLDHPNVVPVYEVGERDGMLFVATRWIDGRTLEEVVSSEGPLDLRRAVRIVNQVASALQAAHDGGILHRAIRPSNVLLTATDFVYLTDFGLARRQGDMTGLTVQQQLLDRYDFVAPEYVAGQTVDERADIYGLGGVLYFVLTGQVPYPEANPSAKLYAHTSAPAPVPSRLRPDVPHELDAVVQRAMAKSPDERQRSAAEFAFEASGAVGLSSPPWTARRSRGQLAPPAPGPPAGAPAGEDGSHAGRPAPRDGSADAHSGLRDRDGGDRFDSDRDGYSRLGQWDADGDGRSLESDGRFTEPVRVYGRRGRSRSPSRSPSPSRSRLLAWSLILIVFLAAPVALLVAVLH
ncbi:MAG TPA: serine/threonine-protein kinase [Solirubrobacteraceae bacterium]|nr:serine/threonine-protein kinase [Solirubrobacteraceae bacterium]